MNTESSSTPNQSTTRPSSRFAKLAGGFAGTVLIGTLALGSVASAAGPSNGVGGSAGRQRPSAETVCADQDAAAAKMAAAKTKVAARIAELTTKRDAAAAAGKTEAVTRIDRRIDRLEKMLSRIEKRIAQFPTWVAEHCA